MKNEIKEIQFAHVKDHLLGLFDSTRPDPYGTPIRDEIVVKKILFGSQMLLMTIEGTSFLKGLEVISRRRGNTGFFIGDVSNEPQQFYFVPFSQKDNYWSTIEIIEHVVLSESGDWGYVQSDEHHGLLAMKHTTDYSTLKMYIQDVDGEHAVRAMIEHWLEMKTSFTNFEVDCTWIRPLMLHIYDEEKANHILSQFSL